MQNYLISLFIRNTMKLKPGYFIDVGYAFPHSTYVTKQSSRIDRRAQLRLLHNRRAKTIFRILILKITAVIHVLSF